MARRLPRRTTMRQGLDLETHEPSGDPLGRLLEETDLVGAIRFDAAGRVQSCSAAMSRLLGRAVADVEGAPLDAVLTPPDAAALRALLRDGRRHVAGRVRLAFRDLDREPIVLECAITLDDRGGALLGAPPRRDEPGSFAR